MPLSSENFAQDWSFALNIAGLETDIKRTYEYFILSQQYKPDIFVDVGTNFGTHSLLFLVNEIETLSIEPNTECYEYFKRACDQNDIIHSPEPVAIGAESGVVELEFPEGESWLGSVNSETKKKFNPSKKMITVEVEQKTLDEYLPRLENKRVLLKIDTEGHEHSVLQGALKTIRLCQPFIIFESWGDKERFEIFTFFESQNYKICSLPMAPLKLTSKLNFETFLNNTKTNFIALPKTFPSKPILISPENFNE